MIEIEDEQKQIAVAEKKLWVARHEAGHVVAYHHFGKVFKSVSILPEERGQEERGQEERGQEERGQEERGQEERGQGRCILLRRDQGISSLTVTPMMVVACAGVAAEMLWLPEDAPARGWMNQRDVLPLWKLYIALYGEETSFPWAGRCWLEAEALMQSYHASVGKIAAALLDRGMITGAEAVRLMVQ